MPGAKRWIFTINNWTDEQLLHLRLIGESEQIQYLVYGRELAPTTGTPHLQGFVIFPGRRTLEHVSRLLPQGHFEIARTNPSQCREYCTKDGDFEEFGTLPGKGAGKRTDWDALKDWLREQPQPPSDTTLAEKFPSLYGRYGRSVRHFRDLFARYPVPTLGEYQLRPWQGELETRLAREPDDRTIEFLVDPSGNAGKSWYAGNYHRRHQCDSQILRIGKRDDLAHVIDPECRVFFIDVPRGGMEHLQYVILESLKDGYVFSPKYDSTTKKMRNKVHVIVFSNEEPSSTALSRDRYMITYI